jgi:alpha-N-acetylglucosamine transferase
MYWRYWRLLKENEMRYKKEILLCVILVLCLIVFFNECSSCKSNKKESISIKEDQYRKYEIEQLKEKNKEKVEAIRNRKAIKLQNIPDEITETRGKERIVSYSKNYKSIRVMHRNYRLTVNDLEVEMEKGFILIAIHSNWGMAGEYIFKKIKNPK